MARYAGLWLVAIVVLAARSALAAEGAFNYKQGGLDWPDSNPLCGDGDRQTPIDFPVPEDLTAMPTEDEAEMVVLARAPELLGDLPIADSTGESLSDLKVDFAFKEYNSDALDYVAEALGVTKEEAQGYAEKYLGEPAQMHWHVYSEHAFNGQLLAMEGHMVRVIPCKDEADATLPDGTCYGVLGVAYTLGAENAEVQFLLDGVNGNATVPESTTVTNWFPEAQRNFYRYQGSLTTPPCSEPVEWVVYSDYLTVSQEQLTLAGNQIYNNFETRTNNRAVQPIGDRTVYYADAVSYFGEGNAAFAAKGGLMAAAVGLGGALMLAML